MIRRSLRFSAFLLFEIFAALIGVFLLGFFLLGWRLSSGPLEVDFFAPYIAEALSDQEAGLTALVPEATLYWYGKGSEIEVQISRLSLRNASGQELMRAPFFQLNIDLWDWLTGERPPIVALLTGSSLRLARDPQGQLSLLSGVSKAAKSTAKPEDLLSWLKPMRTHASLIRSLRIEDFQLEIKNADGALQTQATLPWITLVRVENVLAGSLVLDVTQRNEASSLSLHYGYDLATEVLQLAAKIDNINPADFTDQDRLGLSLQPFNLPLQGELAVRLSALGDVMEGKVRLTGGSGSIFLQDTQLAALPVSDLNISAHIVPAQTGLLPSLKLEQFSLKVFNTLTLSAEGAVLPQQESWQGSLNLAARSVPLARLNELWPPELGVNPRRWILANMQKGVADAVLVLKWQAPAAEPLNADLSELRGNLDIRDGSVSYYSTLPKLERAAATAEFDEEQMQINLLGGKIGNLTLNPSTVRLSNFKGDVERLDGVVRLKGALLDLLPLVNRRPFHYLDAMGIEADAVTGDFTADLSLGFPLLRTLTLDQVDVSASLKMQDLATDRLLKGVPLRNGEMVIALTPEGMDVKGKLEAFNIPAEIEWRENFAKAISKGAPFRAKGKMRGTISTAAFRPLGSMAKEISWQGHAPMQLEFLANLQGNKSLRAMLDLKKVSMALPRFNWTKAAGLDSQLNLKAVAKNKDWQIEQLKMAAPDLEIQGTGAFPLSDTAWQVALSPMRIGRTDAQLSLQSSKDVLRVSLQGASLDLSGSVEGDPEAEASPPLQLDVELEKLWLGDGEGLRNVTLSGLREDGLWRQLSLRAQAADAQADNSNQFDLSLVSDAAGQKMEASCTDLGGLLKAIYGFENLRGGVLSITGAAKKEDGNGRLFGHVRLDNYRVRNLSPLASLISVVSPTGLIELASGQGMVFESLRGEFDFQPDVEILYLQQFRTRGSSVGLSADGHFNLAKDVLTLNGTIVPASFLNRLVAFIPILGDLLTGGGDGVFAATYKLSGPLTDPKVQVNPAAALAPGFLRQLFFMEPERSEGAATQKIAPLKKQNFNR